jgi:hypothetical protein
MQNITDVVTLLTNEYAKLNGDLTTLLAKQKADRTTLQEQVQIRRRALKALGAAIPKPVKAPKQPKATKGKTSGK